MPELVALKRTRSTTSCSAAGGDGPVFSDPSCARAARGERVAALLATRLETGGDDIGRECLPHTAVHHAHDDGGGTGETENPDGHDHDRHHELHQRESPSVNAAIAATGDTGLIRHSPQSSAGGLPSRNVLHAKHNAAATISWQRRWSSTGRVRGESTAQRPLSGVRSIQLDPTSRLAEDRE